MESNTLATELGSIVKKQLMDEAQRALADWRAAENFLNYAQDPDLIECAVFDLEAARKKYSFIIKKLRENSEA